MFRGRSVLAAVALLWLGAVGVGCGGDDDDNAGAGGSGTTAAAIAPRFVPPTSGVPTYGDVPFPSDVYLESDGTVVDEIPGIEKLIPQNSAMLVAGMSKMNGFGVTTGSFFRVDMENGTKNPFEVEIDDTTLPKNEAESLTATATAFMIDLDAADGAGLAARVPSVASWYHKLSGSQTPPGVYVHPARGFVLEEGHHYAAILTTGLKTLESDDVKGGQDIGVTAAFADIASGKNRSTDFEKTFGNAIDKALKIDPSLKDKIIAIAPLTTQKSSSELADLRAQIASETPPQLSWVAADIAPAGVGLFADTDAALPAGYTATLDDWLGSVDKLPDNTDDPAFDQGTGIAHDAIAAIGTAVFEADNFLAVKPDGYSDPGHAIFTRDASNKVVANPDKPKSKIWVTIALPKGTMPASGFPVMLVEHGIGGDRSFMLALANTWAKQGWATVSIEPVAHGSRATLDGNLSDTTGVKSKHGASNATYDGPDGFVDNNNAPTDLFGELLNLGAMRDQFRQSVLDYGSAIEMISNPTLDLGPLKDKVAGAKFDPTRIGYFGDSLSGILGSMVASVDPKCHAFLLNVAGGGLISEMAINSPVVGGSFLSLAAVANFTLTFDTPVRPGHPIVPILQSTLDPADPLLYAKHIALDPVTINGVKNTPKNVVQIEVAWDDIVPNEANEALIRASGFALASPSVDSLTGLDLPKVEPKNGAISGYPGNDATAVAVQASPANHGADFYNRDGERKYKIPYGRFDQDSVFPPQIPKLPVKQPYLGLQTMGVEFVQSVFDGKAGEVKDFPTPVLDFDDDGTPDATDPDPLDPTKKLPARRSLPGA